MDFHKEVIKQRERDKASYLENPKAFWLRPDKWDHGCPPWEIEGEYKERRNGYHQYGYHTVAHGTNVHLNPDGDIMRVSYPIKK